MTVPAGVESIKRAIRSIPDFPKKGVLFRDITPVLADPAKFRACIRYFQDLTKGKVDVVVSIESRGFILGSALAYALGAGFVPIRKEGKLPCKTHSCSYQLEYGRATVEVHADAIHDGDRVILIDDVLATGGTAQAAVKLVEKFKGKLAGIYFLIELEGLKGRAKLRGYPLHSMVRFQ